MGQWSGTAGAVLRDSDDARESVRHQTLCGRFHRVCQAASDEPFPSHQNRLWYCRLQRQGYGAAFCGGYEECESITRVGTVFYMLEPNDDGNLVDEKSAEFTDIYGENPEPIEHRLEMAKYTPSFFKDYWKYVVLTTMEIEYDWRYYPGLPKPE